MAGASGRKADEILFDVLEAPEGQREALLAEACGEDAALREEVESLLAAHARAGQFLRVSSPESTTPNESVPDDAGRGHGAGVAHTERPHQLCQ